MTEVASGLNCAGRLRSNRPPAVFHWAASGVQNHSGSRGYPRVGTADADPTPIDQRALARHHSAGVTVVPVLSRKSAIRQSFVIQHIERVAATLITDLAGLGEDCERKQDVVMPMARIVQLDEVRSDHAAIGQPSVEPPA
jgi:hypothetical protein